MEKKEGENISPEATNGFKKIPVTFGKKPNGISGLIANKFNINIYNLSNIIPRATDNNAKNKPVGNLNL